MAKDIIRKEDALEYHEKGTPGKIEVVSTKETKSQRDLSLAYSPGVAYPCLEIAANKEDAYRYTAKGNLVAVISNGTAVLGLGNIGPEASKPVMEGKGVLFKIFAGIDVFDIEIAETDPDAFVRIVKSLEPTFGGINLEDIKAPECFEIETRLKQEMNIPVMHDDQHGTAIISGAALLNAVELSGKKLSEVKVVVSGAGASAISCAKIFVELGVDRKNFVMCDSKGPIRSDRTDLNASKREFATDRDVRSLEEAIAGADVFLGLSKGNVLSPEMLLKMAENPIVFALANPDPEIAYDLAMQTRDDLYMATGRSDHPNQVNNVLGFPYIFRGALDVRATEINEAMKLAAVKAIAELAKQPVPESVTKAYNLNSLTFGREYFIPKPVDPRLLTTVAPAVAKAAIETGVAKFHIDDWDAYKAELRARMGEDDNTMRRLTVKAKQAKKRIVFAEGDDIRVLKAVRIAKDEGIVEPILLGSAMRIQQLMTELGIDPAGVTIINPRSSAAEEQKEQYAKRFHAKMQRKGITMAEALDLMNKRTYFGSMMVELGEADALISGVTRHAAQSVVPALEVIGVAPGVTRIGGMHVMLTKKGPLFLADTTIQENPSAEELAELAMLVADRVRTDFNIEPRLAFVSFANFGSSKAEDPKKMGEACQLFKAKAADVVADGDMQAGFALDNIALSEFYAFSELADEKANVLIFPNLSAANISYQLLEEIAEVEAVGPVILGMNKPVCCLAMGSTVRDIVNMITIANVEAQRHASK